VRIHSEVRADKWSRCEADFPAHRGKQFTTCAITRSIRAYVFVPRRCQQKLSEIFSKYTNRLCIALALLSAANSFSPQVSIVVCRHLSLLRYLVGSFIISPYKNTFKSFHATIIIRINTHTQKTSASPRRIASSLCEEQRLSFSLISK
jgi:hypothetical protein